MPREYYDEHDGVIDMQEAQDRSSLRLYRANAFRAMAEGRSVSALAEYICGEDFAGSTLAHPHRPGNRLEPVRGECGE